MVSVIANYGLAGVAAGLIITSALLSFGAMANSPQCRLPPGPVERIRNVCLSGALGSLVSSGICMWSWFVALHLAYPGTPM